MGIQIPTRSGKFSGEMEQHNVMYMENVAYRTFTPIVLDAFLPIANSINAGWGLVMAATCDWLRGRD